MDWGLQQLSPYTRGRPRKRGLGVGGWVCVRFVTGFVRSPALPKSLRTMPCHSTTGSVELDDEEDAEAPMTEGRGAAETRSAAQIAIRAIATQTHLVAISDPEKKKNERRTELAEPQKQPNTTKRMLLNNGKVKLHSSKAEASVTKCVEKKKKKNHRWTTFRNKPLHLRTHAETTNKY